MEPESQQWPHPSAPAPRPAGWYPDQQGVTRFWDGVGWTEHIAPPPPPGQVGQPHVAAALPVSPNVRQARDRAQYARPQTGHSLIKHLLLGAFVLWIPTVYYAVSPNHYFHL